MSSNDFWSDPKVYLSLLAILVSIAAFVFTLANQTDQNRRWDALNLGNAVIKQAEFIKFNSMTIAEAQQTNWGYNVLLLQNAEEPGKVFTINALQIFDPVTNEVIPNSKFCLTMTDVSEELQDLGLLPANVIVKRVFKGRIVIENIGKTEIKNLSTTVNGLNPNGEWEPCFVSNEKLNLGPSQTLNVPLSINFTLEGNIPQEMNFEMKWEYQDANNNDHKKSQKMKWQRVQNRWSFLEATGQ